MKLKEKLWRAIPIAKRLLRERLQRMVVNALSDKTFKKNVFHQKHSKRVLIGSQPNAFGQKKLTKYHTIQTEIFEVAKIFDRLGYVVDVTMGNNTSVDLSKYDVIYCGREIMLDAWRRNLPMKTIFFSPGAHPFYCYEATAKKNLQVHRDKGVWLTTSSRYLTESPAGYFVDNFADLIIVYGNQFVLDQYLKYDTRHERYALLPAFYFDCHKPDLEHKDFAKARHGICWLGGLGLIHKGLDIVIDFALAHPEFELHICGATKREREFWNYYRPLIAGKTNIIDHGFINIESDEFVQIMSQCAWMINPSISEGGAAAVFNVVANGGLLPIYSKSTGLDLADWGYEIEEVDYKLFEQKILEVSQLPESELRAKSIATCNFVRSTYTLDNYRANMWRIISNFLQ